MFEPILAAVIPVLITAGIGFLWVRSGRSFENGFLTPLITDISTPCLVISTLTRTAVPGGAFAMTAAACITAIIGFAACAALLLPLLKLPMRTYLPCVAFPNAGNLGLPVALYAFGPEGLSYAIVFFALCSIGNYTIGQAINAGGANWLGMLRMPIVYAVVLGVAGSVTHVDLPAWLANTLALIGSVSVPMMLLMLGASLARLHVASLGPALTVTVIRIGAGALVGVGVTYLFGISGIPRSVLIVQCAMPVAVFNYLFALRWNNRPDEVAGLVVVSTFVSIITVPLLLHFLLS